eukprot:gene1200-2332_t
MQVLAFYILIWRSGAAMSAFDPLLEAVALADVNRVKTLLQHKTNNPNIVTNLPGVFINRVEKSNGRTSLLLCGYHVDSSHSVIDIDEKCYKIAKMLNKSGANMSHVDKNGWNAIAMGAARGYNAFCDYLIRIGVDLETKDSFGRTPLMKSVAHGHMETTQLLLSNNANISEVDNHGWNSLHFATRQALTDSTHVPMLSLLLDKMTPKLQNFHLTINHRDIEGRTPLMMAVLGRHSEIIQILLDNNADPRILDNNNISMISILSNTINENESINTIRDMLMDAVIRMAEHDHSEWLRQSLVEEEDQMEGVLAGKDEF